MANHNEVGKIGENLARKYLEENGYKILEQNYKTKYAEIDLVAERPGKFLQKGTLVFVEVRTKVGEQWGSPEDTINKSKLWKVLQNAKSYAGFKKWQGPERIDAICIVLSAQGGPALGWKNDYKLVRLTHHENIVS
jgi:putative endonuclease